MNGRDAELTAPVFSALGIPVAACIVVSSIFIVLMPALAGYPVTTDDVKGPALFGGLSLVLLAIAWRAYRRVKRNANATSVAPFLTRAVPYLIVVGIALGVVIGRGLGGFGVDAKEDRVNMLCDYVVRDHHDLMPACRQQGGRCLREGNTQADAHWNEGPSSSTDSPVRTVAEKYTVECFQAALKL